MSSADLAVISVLTRLKFVDHRIVSSMPCGVPKVLLTTPQMFGTGRLPHISCLSTRGSIEYWEGFSNFCL